MKSFFLALLIIALTGGARATIALSTHLDLVPDHALPGIPVVFVVTVTNPNTVPQVFTTGARLKAIRRDGSTFTVLWGGREEETSVEKEELVLRAGATVKLFVPVGPMLMLNSAFFDPRLCVPGTYDLQLAFADGVVKTNVARLTVDEPSGADLAFWNALLASTPDHCLCNVIGG